MTDWIDFERDRLFRECDRREALRRKERSQMADRPAVQRVVANALRDFAAPRAGGGEIE